MPDGDLLAWFRSLAPFAQIFVGLFLVMVALPFATLIVMQFIETLRSLGESRSTGHTQRKEDEKRRDR